MASFKDYIFCFERLPVPTKNELKTLIEERGAVVQFMFNDKVTHLVAPQSELSNPNNFNIQKARKRGVKIVTPKAVVEEAAKAAKERPVLSERMHDFKNSGSSLSSALAYTNTSATLTSTYSTASTSLVPLSTDVNNAPTITLLLPSSGSSSGGYQVAIFGLNFTPGPGFRVKFGSLDCVHYEFHSSTAVVATLASGRSTSLQGSEALVAASNDHGRSWGFPAQFCFTDVVASGQSESELTLLHSLTSQLANVHRAIVNIQLMEGDLRSQLQSLSSYKPSNKSVYDADVAVNEPESNSGGVAHGHLERELKLFISSPFRDMQMERDTIVKRVIPLFRRMCLERDVLFSYVDLRWGVTGAQSEGAATLAVCLKEIETSDMFLGLYGERYGWHISDERDTGDNEILARSFEMARKQFPWVEKHKDRSVTEVEFRMILEQLYKGATKEAWFYLRDAYYVEEVPKSDRHLFQSEGPGSFEKLSQLKLDIVQSEHATRNYNRPDQIAELVLRDLEELLDRKYPADELLSPQKREEFRHLVYGRGLTKAYLPNESYNLLLDKYVSGEETKPQMVVGARGVGKSALLANWSKRYSEHHPEDIVIVHYIGCSPASSAYQHVLWRVMHTTSRALSFAPQLPAAEDADAVTRFFPKWIESAVEACTKNHRKIVIVLDGFDKLDERNNSSDLVWFPATYPACLRVVLSVAPSHVHDVLVKRGCSKFEVTPLSEAERKSLIRLHLNKQSKKLNEKQEFTIAGATQTANARFLLTLLDDIIVFGEHDDLDKKINTDLHAQNTSELYEIVLERMERDYDRGSKGIVGHFVSNIWASRRGLLLEEELSVIMSEQSFQPHEWQEFFVAAQEMLLTDMGDLIAFSNEDVRSAVQNRYLKTEKQRVEVHRRLANFFQNMEDTVAERRIEELPYQLDKAQQWKELEKVLVDLQVFSKLYSEAHKFDLFRYWRQVETLGKIEVDQSYRGVITRSRFPAGLIVSDLIFDLGTFLQSMNKFAACEEMYHKAIQYYTKASQRLAVAKVYSQLAALFIIQRRYNECEEMLKRAEEIYKEEKGDEAVEIGGVLKQLGTLYVNRGKLKEALEVLQHSLHICETRLGSDNLTTADVFYELGCCYLSLRELEKGESNLLRALRIKEAKLGDWDPEVSHILNRLGSLYIEQDQFNDAESCFERALIIREAKLGPEHSRVAQTLRHMISLYEMLEKYDAAIAMCQRAAKITEKVFGAESFEMSGVLLRIGSLCWTKAETDSRVRPQFKQTATENVIKARDIRIKLFGEDHSSTKEAIELYDEIVKGPQHTAPSPPPPAPKSVTSGAYPPPPPPPPGMEQQLPLPLQMAMPQQMMMPQQTRMPSISINPASFGGPPPPPPPSSVQMQMPQQTRLRAKASAPIGVQWTQQLNTYDVQSMNRMNESEVAQRADAGQQAKKMLAQNKRKIQLKTLW